MAIKKGKGFPFPLINKYNDRQAIKKQILMK